MVIGVGPDPGGLFGGCSVDIVIESCTDGWYTAGIGRYDGSGDGSHAESGVKFVVMGCSQGSDPADLVFAGVPVDANRGFFPLIMEKGWV